LRQQVADQAKILAEQQRALEEFHRNLEVLKGQLNAASGVAQPPQPAKVAQPEKTAQPEKKAYQVAASTPTPTQSDKSSAEPPVGQAPPQPEVVRPPEVAPLGEQPGVFGRRGHFTLEPSLQYSYSSSDRVSIVGYTIIPALVIGLIDVRTVHRNSLVATLTGRYGLTNRLEAEIRIPYVYRDDDTISRPIDLEPSSEVSVFNADGAGLGDIEVAVRYQINTPDPGYPFFLAGLRLKTRTGEDPFEVDYAPGTSAATGTLQTSLPTGSGFYTVQPSLTFIYPTDPAVLFGGINYQWNMKRDVDKTVAGGFVGEVDPGDAVGVNFGMGLALNERNSFSIGYEHTWYDESESNGVTPAGVTDFQLASLAIGYSYRVSKSSTLSLSVAAGLTGDSPDTQVTVRLPITF
jgi:hypothetical protein